MERWKAILKKLLWPGGRWAILMVLLSAAALFLAFGTRLRETPFPYAAYCLSAYGLTIFVAAIVPALRQAPRFLHSIPLAHRYMTDKYFSVWYGLALSFIINLGFAMLKLAYAVLYSSFWEGGLAIYNMLLCVVRLYLLASFPKGQKRFSDREEWRRYRMTGRLLFLLDAALAVISTMIVLRGNGYLYPGTLVYAMACYAFYSLALAIINAIKYRRFNSPVLSAAKAVNLTTALVSMFSLETALIAQFGADQPQFRLIMTSCTAFAVCVTVLGSAVYMVRRSRKILMELKPDERGGTKR
ncbi:MAG: hypothetical protein K2M42_01170 [Oscillospiraceae bacterium]|nr:hypothetical protein [Oscillospiraceae bacterium]